MGVLVIKALLFGVCMKAPDFWKLTYLHSWRFEVLRSDWLISDPLSRVASRRERLSVQFKRSEYAQINKEIVICMYIDRKGGREQTNNKQNTRTKRAAVDFHEGFQNPLGKRGLRRALLRCGCRFILQLQARRVATRTFSRKFPAWKAQ